jgi:hypothetical protein
VSIINPKSSIAEYYGEVFGLKLYRQKLSVETWRPGALSFDAAAMGLYESAKLRLTLVCGIDYAETAQPGSPAPTVGPGNCPVFQIL